MAGISPNGLFNIPLQSKPTSSSFDCRPKQVEAWVAELPMANTGESARRIYTALRDMNRVKLADGDRFKTLEQFRAPVNQITRVLKKHFVNQNLPLSPKSQKVAELAIELHMEMAIGYMSVINDRVQKTFSMPSHRILTTCLHRASRYLSNILLFSYQIYIQHPEHVWLQIHRLYLFAEEQKLHNTSIVDLHHNEAPLECSIASLYKQALLMSLAGPYRLRQRIIDLLYLALEEWAPKCRILKFGESSAGNFAFTINMNSDSAPGFFRDDAIPNPDYFRQVDTSKLTELLNQAIQTPGTDVDSIPVDILKRLYIAWSGHAQRSFSRTTNHNEVTITLGLSATHHYIDEIIRPLLQDPTATCPSATLPLKAGTVSESVDDTDPLLDERANFTSTPVFGISNIDDHTPDVWDPDYTYRASNPIYSFRPAEQEAESKRKATLYAPLSCKGLNESAGGYCLLGFLSYGKDSPKVQVGELVGFIDSIENETRMSIGIIRRIKNWTDGLELGIQKLAPCADAVATAALDTEDEHRKYHRSLALPEIAGLNQQASIITHTWNKVGDVLIANIHGHLSKIQLVRQLENSGVFSQFEYSVVEEPEESTTQSDSTPNDEFAAVWNIL